MGWDAYAVMSQEAAGTWEGRHNPVLHSIFFRANEELIRIAGFGGQLLDGTLGSVSLPFLQCATPLKCIDYDDLEFFLFWSKEDVTLAYSQAVWTFACDSQFKGVYDAQYLNPPAYDILDIYDEDDFHYHKSQVRLFLEVCAANRLAIEFSW